MHDFRMDQHRFGRLWTECQNCAQDMTNEINCGATDCPIFYMREKARVDLDERSQNIIRMTNYYNKLYRERKSLNL